MERGFVMIFVSVWAVTVTILLLLFVLRNRIIYRKINRILEQLIEGRKIDDIPFNESELSLFYHQIKMISHKLDFEIGRADLEKEQIKQLISNISHQLKTPLANVMMYEELLGSNDLTKEQQSNFLHKLKTQTEKIDWLLESLFKMSKLEQNVIEFDVKKEGIKKTLRNAVSAVFERAEEKNIDIHVMEFEDVVLLHNPKWTLEVFVNLLENAIKYTSFGLIEISFEQLETYSIVHIKDNGIGISKEDIPHIFERFYRSKNAEQTEGSGIGLYLSKMILEKEKGYLTVKSELGKGSVFSVFLQNC